MSRRFGRQQKRKMLNLMKKLEVDNTRLSQRLEDARIMKSCIKSVASILGKHFIALPPETFTYSEIPEFIHIAKMLSPQHFPCLRNVEQVRLVDRALHYLDVYSAELKVDQLRDYVHVLIRSPNREAGYAMSRSALNHISLGELSNYLGLILGRHLQGELSHDLHYSQR